jgi:hypothetical protein
MLVSYLANSSALTIGDVSFRNVNWLRTEYTALYSRRQFCKVTVASFSHYKLHGAEPFLRSLQLLSCSRLSRYVMEPEEALSCSHEPSADPCSERTAWRLQSCDRMYCEVQGEDVNLNRPLIITPRRYIAQWRYMCIYIYIYTHIYYSTAFSPRANYTDRLTATDRRS